MKNSISILLLILSVKVLQAQDSTVTKSYKRQHIIDVTPSFTGKEMTAALSWNHFHGFGKNKQRFKIGYGLRYTLYAGITRYYTTAPSKYTSPVQGITTIFSETIEENIDTVAFANPLVNSLNISIHLQYSIHPKMELGFNIDAVGFSFGGSRKGSIISSVLNANEAPVSDAKPTTLNLLLTSDNDIGSLNSEFYLRYWISSRIGIRAGYTFYFSEYTTDRVIGFDQNRIVNDRYRLKSGLILLGLSWKPFNK